MERMGKVNLTTEATQANTQIQPTEENLIRDNAMIIETDGEVTIQLSDKTTEVPILNLKPNIN